MDGTAVKQIAEMQSDIENYKSDLITLLTLVKNPESADYLNYNTNVALDIADEIVKLQNK